MDAGTIILLLVGTGIGWASLSAIEKARARRKLVACPNCAEMIQRTAKVCRFCGRDVQ